MKLELIAVPVVASYRPTLFPAELATYKLLLDRRSRTGASNPVMKLEFSAAPVLVSYLPTELLPLWAT
jgi:hypothetical protein